MAKLKHCTLTPLAEQTLLLDATHGQNLSALQQEQLWRDAVSYTLFMLPYAQALTFTLTFIAMAYEREMAAEQHSLWQQARRWPTQSSEALRHELFQQAEAIGLDNPISCLALSIFWSEGSMTLSELDPVYPPGHLAPMMLTNVITLILQRSSEQPAQQIPLIEHFFQLGHQQFAQLPAGQPDGRQHYLYNG